MNNNIIKLKDIDKYREFLGDKTVNLKKCADMGFCVPEFIALPASISEKLLIDDLFRKNISDEIGVLLKCEKYAVRSSAFIEDGKNDSWAGRFLTRTDIPKEKIAEAIYDLIFHARDICELNKFSIIVQEYISSDVAGVVFTRDPNGGREMVIEYSAIRCEKIVEGKIKPDRFLFYWQNIKSKELPRYFSIDDIDSFKRIEKEFGSPQDIEWCIKDDNFYLLQSRPISTISDKEYNRIISLEKDLPENEKYYFEKNEISETVSKPTRFTLDILRSIYKKDGPVDRVYKKHKIDYRDTDFLKIIGNELYVDKEKEIKSLLPAYSYFNNRYYLPRISKISGLIPTMKNLYFINQISSSDHEIFFKELKSKIEKEKEFRDTKEAIANFLLDYELVFEINLLSGVFIKRLRSMMLKDQSVFLKIINGSSFFALPDKYHICIPSRVKGNSIDISDESAFITFDNEKKEDHDIRIWWDRVSESRKIILQKKIEQAVVFHRLREWGRCLAIKNIDIIRKLLLDIAREKQFKNDRDIYFVSLNEVINNNVEEVICQERKYIYDKYDSFDLPGVIFSSFVEKRSEIYGISSGSAEGILLTVNDIDQRGDKEENIILYTEILSPNLFEYFDKIKGIISNNGSLLSHLAILAREKKIPAIVGVSLSKIGLKKGDRVKIDGNTGKIKRL